MVEKKKVKKIGIEVAAPKEACSDKKCPFHGDLSVRGKSFVGRVVKSKMANSCVVEWERRRYVPKYERYEKRRTKIKAHNPPCINASDGDMVRIMETRPLSKMIHFVVVEKIKKE